MAEEYTPTTAQVRQLYANSMDPTGFDRWLARHDAELRAEVERLRAQMSALSAHAGRLEEEHDEARQQLADLRAGIEALATEGEAWGRGVAVELSKRLRALLAGSGEQPGEVYGPRPAACCGKCPPIEGGGYDCTCEGNPRCVRERVKGALHEHDCTPDGPPHLAREWAALSTQERAEVFAWFTRPLVAMGQGVTVEWGVGYGDQHRAALSREYAEEWVADDDAWAPGEERWLVTRQVGPWTRIAVRPSEKEADRDR